MTKQHNNIFHNRLFIVIFECLFLYLQFILNIRFTEWKYCTHQKALPNTKCLKLHMIWMQVHETNTTQLQTNIVKELYERWGGKRQRDCRREGIKTSVQYSYLFIFVWIQSSACTEVYSHKMVVYFKFIQVLTIFWGHCFVICVMCS